MRVVYIAGPYRGADAFAIAENVRNAERLALAVWRMGAAALCPHCNTAHFQGCAPDTLWLDGDLAMMKRCDAVLLTPDWKRSEGARLERRAARRAGIPVFETLAALRTWLEEAPDEVPQTPAQVP